MPCLFVVQEDIKQVRETEESALDDFQVEEKPWYVLLVTVQNEHNP